MGVIGKKLRGLEGGRLAFMCPGCGEMHQITTGAGPGPRWGYNGNPDAPTFTPSVLVRGVQRVVVDGRWTGEWRCDANDDPLPSVCHSFIRDGRIQFLGDCTHSLAGQTVDLPDVGDAA